MWAEVLGVERVGSGDGLLRAGRPLAAGGAGGRPRARGVGGGGAAGGAVRGAQPGPLRGGGGGGRARGRRRGAGAGPRPARSAHPAVVRAGGDLVPPAALAGDARLQLPGDAARPRPAGRGGAGARAGGDRPPPRGVPHQLPRGGRLGPCSGCTSPGRCGSRPVDLAALPDGAGARPPSARAWRRRSPGRSTGPAAAGSLDAAAPGAGRAPAGGRGAPLRARRLVVRGVPARAEGAVRGVRSGASRRRSRRSPCSTPTTRRGSGSGSESAAARAHLEFWRRSAGRGAAAAGAARRPSPSAGAALPRRLPAGPHAGSAGAGGARLLPGARRDAVQRRCWRPSTRCCGAPARART